MTAIVFHCDRNNEYKNTEFVCVCILSSANFAQSFFEWKCSGHAFQFPLNSSQQDKKMKINHCELYHVSQKFIFHNLISSCLHSHSPSNKYFFCYVAQIAISRKRQCCWFNYIQRKTRISFYLLMASKAVAFTE